MVIAKKFVLAKHFEGEPKRSDFTLVEETLPDLKDGEFLAKAEFLSVDPYMRGFASRLALGDTMLGTQIAEVVASKNKDFPIGKRIFASVGWRTYTIMHSNPNDVHDRTELYILPEFDGLPSSLGLGVLGMPGNTAYFAFTEVLQPKAGETLVVSGAAGAVGSHLGQLGKIHGLKVIGITGSDAKCKWLTEELGFDHAINYKKQDVAVALKEMAPNKIDCYADNVGGDISVAVLGQMNTYGRIAVIGTISIYNANLNEIPKYPMIQPSLLFSQSRMEGFQAQRYKDRWFESIAQNLQWIKENKLKWRETITEGFENMPDAFSGMLRGDNTGKAIIKV